MKIGKVLLSFLFLALSYFTYAIYSNPVTGFYPSLFYNISPLIWIVPVISFAASAFIFLDQDQRLKPIAAGCMIISVWVIYFTPFIRTGYPYGRGDVLFQIGAVKSVAESGGFELSDSFGDYPLLHITTAETIIITDLNVDLVFSLIIPALSLMYVSFMYLWARHISSNIKYLVFIFSLLPMFGSYSISVTPNSVSMYYIMVVGYIFYLIFNQSQLPRYQIVSILVISSIIVSHPIAGLILTQCLVVYSIFDIHSSKEPTFIGAVFNEKYYSIAVLAIMYTLWMLESALSSIGNYLTSFLAFLQGIEAEQTARELDRASNLEFYEMLNVLLSLYSGNLLISLLTIGGLAVLLFYWNTGGLRQGEIKVVSFSLIWLFLCGFYIVGGLLYQEFLFPAGRFINMIYVASPMFVAYCVAWFLRSRNIDRENVIIVVISLGVIFSLLLFPLFGGPHSDYNSGQQTHHELQGTQTMLEYKNPDFSMLAYGQYRYEQRVIGPEVRHELNDEFPRNFERHGTLPNRLTTLNDTFIIDELATTRHIYITEADYIQGRQPRITENDESKLGISTIRIYDNGEYRSYINNK